MPTLSYKVDYGSPVILECEIIADPPLLNVYWEKVSAIGTVIINTNSLGTSGINLTSPSLSFDTSTSADSGEYQCIGSNVIGISRSDTVELIVTGGTLLNYIITVY